MGIVYKIKDKKLNDRIKALKVIHPGLTSSELALQRCRQEVDISQDLYHPNIVRVCDLSDHNGMEYFTMEWVEGPSLRDILTERKKENKPLTLEEAFPIISQLCEALAYAHQNTVHRDIKPENILISSHNALKLTDFGIAKMLTPSQFMTTSVAMGTPYYMAPEQKGDDAHVDHRADIYAVGVILFELLTLENTIRPYSPSEINSSLPEEVDLIFKKAMAIKPDQRYQSAKEFFEAMKQSVTGKKLEIPIQNEFVEPRRASLGRVFEEASYSGTGEVKGKYLSQLLIKRPDLRPIARYIGENLADNYVKGLNGQYAYRLGRGVEVATLSKKEDFLRIINELVTDRVKNGDATRYTIPGLEGAQRALILGLWSSRELNVKSNGITDIGGRKARVYGNQSYMPPVSLNR